MLQVIRQNNVIVKYFEKCDFLQFLFRHSLYNDEQLSKIKLSKGK